MADSDRAASIALAQSYPVGLHLNLSSPFTATDIPRDVNERHEKVVRYLRGVPLARWLYNPYLTRVFDLCIEDQVRRFLDLYGKKPTHLDGHHHLHTCPNVLFSRKLEPGIKLRNTITYSKGQKSAFSGFVRSVFKRTIAHKYVTTVYLIQLGEWQLDDVALTIATARSKRAHIEVAVHPFVAQQRKTLLSDAWLSVLSGGALGSFADL